MEETLKSLHAVGFLVQELQELAKKANHDNNRPMHILARNMLESAIKIEQTLTELV